MSFQVGGHGSKNFKCLIDMSKAEVNRFVCADWLFSIPEFGLFNSGSYLDLFRKQNHHMNARKCIKMKNARAPAELLLC